MIKKDLFEFHYGDKSWFFTSSKKPITYNDNTYLPKVLNRTDIDDEDIDKCDTEIAFPYPMQILNADGDDLQALFINKIYFKSVTVTILELYKGETLVIHIGRVIQPKFDDGANTMTLVSSTAETQQNKNILTRKFQKTCSNKIYDRICGLNIEDWSVEVTITAIDRLTVSFTINDGSTYPENYFSRGALYKDGIFTSIRFSENTTISLGREHFGLQVGDVVKIAPGCDQTRSGPCHTLFNNTLRFMGFPNIPNSNPTNDQIIK